MNSLKQALALYAVTDQAWLNGRSLEECVEEAIEGGVTMVQLREKKLSSSDFLKLAEKIKIICHKHQVPFIINDNLEVAIACDADGIHVGQEDMTVGEIKGKWPKDKIIGVSTQTVAESKIAEAAGASYLGVGAVFPTDTKSDAVDVSLEELAAITQAVAIPVCAIGGIHQGNISELYPSGIDGVALVSEIFNQKDIQANARKLVQLVAPFADTPK